MIELAPPTRRRRVARAVGGLLPDTLRWNRFAIIAVIGAVAGLVLPSVGGLKQPALALAFAGLAIGMFTTLLRGRVVLSLGIAVYLCAIQPALRLHAPVLPYLALQYVFLGYGLLLAQLSHPRQKALVAPIVAYGLYVLLEVSGVLLAANVERARSIVVPSLALFSVLLGARSLRLGAKDVTSILSGYVLGAVTLLCFALRSYLAGEITWGTESNAEAAGGMPPNHISVLCSLAAFLSIILSEHTKPTMRIPLLGLAGAFATLMVLTFSRGGTLILVLCAFLYYVILRQQSWRTVFVLLAVSGVGLIVYYSTLEITGGKIAERFGEANTSNRLQIATLGLGLLFDNPILGVGTSNFNQAMTETEFGRSTGAHNELVRAAAEHGLVGISTWIVFAATTVVAAFRVGDGHRSRRALRLVLWIFAITSMFYNGLKLSIQPMLILLAVTAFTLPSPLFGDKPKPKEPPKDPPKDHSPAAAQNFGKSPSIVSPGASTG